MTLSKPDKPKIVKTFGGVDVSSSPQSYPPCPSCGSMKPPICDKKGFFRWKYRVGCGECGSRGPWRDIYRSALIEWFELCLRR